MGPEILASRPMIGLASKMPPKKRAAPQTNNYAQYLAEAHRPLLPVGEAEPPVPAKKKNRPRDRTPITKYDFPDMTIGRKINMPEAGDWRKHHQVFERRNLGWKPG